MKTKSKSILEPQNFSAQQTGQIRPSKLRYIFGLIIDVRIQALFRAKTGALPFWHACSRLKHGNVRGFLSWLNLVQAVHLHACARLEGSVWTRMASAALTTLPWWMDRRGGWTIVLRGPSTFGESVAIQPHATMLSLLDSFQGSRAVEESSGGALEDELLEAVRLSEGGLRHYENYRDKRHFKQRRLRRRKRRLNTVEAAMNAEAGLETAPPGETLEIGESYRFNHYTKSNT